MRYTIDFMYNLNEYQFTEFETWSWRAASRWLLTMETRIRSHITPCRICSGQSGSVKNFHWIGLKCSPLSYHSLNVTCSHMSTNVESVYTILEIYGVTRLNKSMKSKLIPNNCSSITFTRSCVKFRNQIIIWVWTIPRRIIRFLWFAVNVNGVPGQGVSTNYPTNC